MATAKAVAAGNSCRQEDVIATANLSRKAVADMLTACKVKIHFLAQECACVCVCLNLLNVICIHDLIFR